MFNTYSDLYNYFLDNAIVLQNYSKFQSSELAKTIRENSDNVSIMELVRVIQDNQFELECETSVVFGIFEYYCKNTNTDFNSHILDFCYNDKNSGNSMPFLNIYKYIAEKPSNAEGKSPILDYIGNLEVLDELTNSTIEDYYECPSAVVFNGLHNNKITCVNAFGGLFSLVDIYLYKAVVREDSALLDRVCLLNSLIEGDVKGCTPQIHAKSLYKIIENTNTTTFTSERKSLLRTLKKSVVFHSSIKMLTNEKIAFGGFHSKSLSGVRTLLMILLHFYRHDEKEIKSLIDYIVEEVGFDNFINILFSSSIVGSNYAFKTIDESFATYYRNFDNEREIWKCSGLLGELFQMYEEKSRILSPWESYSVRKGMELIVSIILTNPSREPDYLLSEVVGIMEKSINTLSDTKQFNADVLRVGISFASISRKFSREAINDAFKRIKYESMNVLLDSNRVNENLNISEGLERKHLVYLDLYDEYMTKEEYSELIKEVIESGSCSTRDIARYARKVVKSSKHSVDDKLEIFNFVINNSNYEGNYRQLAALNAFLSHFASTMLETSLLSEEERKYMIVRTFEISFNSKMASHYVNADFLSSYYSSVAVGKYFN